MRFSKTLFMKTEEGQTQPVGYNLLILYLGV